jgi:Flp pilus assembly protein TadG
MKRNIRKKSSDLRDLYNFYRSFAKEEDGMVTIFACFMIFIMMMVAGIGVDMMRHEMERTRIQAVADRAVLAATDLDQEYGGTFTDSNGDEQTYDAYYVVRDYFDKSGMADFVIDVRVSPPAVNSRVVTVDAGTDVNTMFMDWFGVETLHVPATSTAEETKNKVEISMVLDISGSMRNNSKMENLRDAASTFVDAVLKPETRDLVSVSIVPYTAQVNAGKDIFDLLDIPVVHHIDQNGVDREVSYCVDFQDADFDTAAIYDAGSLSNPGYEHMLHFEESSTSGNFASNSWGEAPNPGCPKQDFETIQAFSQDADDLKATIAQFEPRANTSIHLGMKWGVAMLDPAWQDFNEVLPDVDAAFRARPAAYSDDETLKTVILMTDGVNVLTRRVRPEWYANASNRQIFSNVPAFYVANRTRFSSNDLMYTKYTPSQGDSLLQNVCDAAKENNIVIWSIGFEVNDHGANVMRDCASSPSHFFRVEGVEISEAFQSIARQINALRLTQ